MDLGSESSTPNTHASLESALPIGRLGHRFIEHCRVARSLSGHTLRAYAGDLSGFVKHVGPDSLPGAIDRDRITDYIRRLREMRLKEATVRRRVATLKVLFRWLEHEGIIELSVFHRMDLSIRLPQRLPRALEAIEMCRLLRVSEPRCYPHRKVDYEKLLVHAAVIILFSTGLRISELLSIRLTDVAARESTILVHGKGNRERRVYVSGREGRAVLKRLLSRRNKIPGSEHLFVGKAGQPVSPQFIRVRLRAVAKRAAINRRVTPHMLRHTAATQLLDAGVDIRFVQKLLGHSSIATTQVYTQVTDAMLKTKLNAANILLRVRHAM